MLDLSEQGFSLINRKGSKLALQQGDLAVLGSLATLRLLRVPCFDVDHAAANVTVALLAASLLPQLAVQCPWMRCPNPLPNGWDGGVDSAVALKLRNHQQQRILQILEQAWMGFEPVRLVRCLGLQAQPSS